jgi:putative PIN family toxin of toxin-antitoxin system
MTTIERRFVLDTNCVISALLLKQSVARQAFDQARTTGKLLLSVDTLTELDSVLRRDKFNKYVLEEERLEFLVRLVQQAELVEVTEEITDCRDPKDNKFLELAVSGSADCIVSGDEDLRILHPFRDIPIVSPRDFLDIEWERDSD